MRYLRNEYFIPLAPLPRDSINHEVFSNELQRINTFGFDGNVRRAVQQWINNTFIVA